MASSSTLFHISIALTIIFVLSPIIASTTSEEPNNAFTFPIKKDDATLQYTIDKVQIGLGSSPIKLSIDIGGWVLWFNNDAGYNASAYQSLSCNDDECGPDPSNVMLFCGTCISRSNTLPPCNQSSACSLNDINPFIMKLGSYAYPGAGLSANIARDGLVINSTRGKKNEVPIRVPDFRFSYVNSGFVTKLASGSKGVVGLGNSPMSLPNQIISTYNVSKQFSICLPSYSTSTGSLSIGASNKTTSHRDLLTTTPLLEKFVGDNSWPANIPSTEYFIGVTSINVDGEPVPFDTSLLSSDNEDSIGGTRLSTGVPYTAFHSDIYDSLVKVYKEKAADMKMEEAAAAAAVAPFEVCYVAKTVKKTASGDFCVPGINLVLQNSSVYWRIEGHNVMKKVNKDVMCLAIVDGGIFFPYMVQYGESLVTAIIIGGHQLESNYLEFDLGSSELRFSSSLVAQGSSCSHLKGKYL